MPQRKCFSPVFPLGQWILIGLLLLILSACSKTTTEYATIHYSYAFPSADTVKNKLASRDAHEGSLAVDRLTLSIASDDGDFRASETITPESKAMSIPVPSGVSFDVVGQAFLGEELRFQGTTSVSALIPGSSAKVSFNLYDVENQPLQVDIGLDNKPANGSSTGASISLSRDYVLFFSTASNLVEDDGNGTTDLFLRDLKSNKIVSLHSNSDGELANDAGEMSASEAVISADGRYVVFTSNASNLVDEDTNGVSDVFLKDTLTGKTIRISLVNGKEQASAASSQPDISNDGRFIAFYSEADLLGDGAGKIFIYDRVGSELFSGVNNGRGPRLSGDGQNFVYTNPQVGGLFLHRLSDFNGQEIVSSGEIAGELASFDYAINKNGQYVVFTANFDTMGIEKHHLYLFDSETKAFSRLSENQDAQPLPMSDYLSVGPSLSDDGRYVVFRSNATIYVKDVISGSLQAIADGVTPFISLDGIRIGYSDSKGRLFLKGNPLYSPVASIAAQTSSPPFDLQSGLSTNPQGITVSWASTNGSGYFRVYVASEPGVTPDNYNSMPGGAQYETVSNSVFIDRDFNEADRIYVIVSIIDDAGESAVSDELTVTVPPNVIDASSGSGGSTSPLDRVGVAVNVEGIGTISPSGTQTIPLGDKASFSIEAGLGYHLDSMIGCSGELSGIIYTTGAITSACIVTATFTKNNYLVSTATTGNGGGVISPTSIGVDHGGSTQFTFTPAPGSQLAGVTGCSGTLTNGTYQTGVITSACTVTATFTKNDYVVSTAINGNGAVSPTSIGIDHGGSTQFTFMPATGSQLTDVTGCSGTLSNGTYQTGDITSACTVTATFTKNDYVVSTATAGNGGGTVSPTSIGIDHGDSTQFTFTPATGSQLMKVTGCSGTLTNGTYQTGVITSACTVTATFTKNNYLVSTATAGNGGGAISPTSIGIDHGGSTQFTFTSATGSQLTGVTGCSGTLSNGTYQTGVITSACTVTATFTKNNYLVSTATAGNGGGTVSPTSIGIDHGGSTQFTFTSATGSQLTDVTGCSGTLSNGTYQTGVITFACTITATFTTIPDTPTSLDAVSGDGEVTLSWAEDASLTYEVHRGESSNFATGPASLIATTLQGASSFTDTSAINSTLYYYRIVGVNGAVKSAASDSVFAAPVAATAPTPPTVATTASSGSIELTFTPSVATDSYKVYFNTTGNVTKADAVAYSGTLTNHTHLGLTDFDLYYYRVSAITGGLEGQLSAEVVDFPFTVKTNWTKAYPLHPNGLVQDVIFTGSQYVAVGNEDLVMTSPDAMTWTARQAGINEGYQQKRVAHDGTGVVMMATRKGLYRSLDHGVSWTLLDVGVVPAGSNITTASSYSGIFYIPAPTSTFVTFVKGYRATTTDNGLSWNYLRMSNRNLHSFSHDGTRYFGQENSGATSELSSSVDGVSWRTAYASPMDNNFSPAENIDYYAVVGDATTGAIFIGVTDAVDYNSSWVYYCDPISSILSCAKITSSSSHTPYRSVAYAPPLNKYYRYFGGRVYSTYFPSSLGGGTSLDVGNPRPESGIKWIERGDQSHLMLFGAYGTLASSPDGVTWARNTPNNSTNHIIWDGSQFVAVGDYYSGTSFDGTSWTYSANQYLLRHVDFDGSLYTAVGSRDGIPEVVWSVDGVSWSPESFDVAPTSGYFRSNSSSSTIRVAVGYDSLIYTSINGGLWSAANITPAPSTGTSFLSVAWNGVAFVAIANGTNQVYRSTNGVDWSLTYSDSASNYSSGVVVKDGVFYSFFRGASGHVIVKSLDGLNWSETVTDQFATSLNYDGELFWNGRNAVSPDAIHWNLVSGTYLFGTIVKSPNTTLYYNGSNGIFR